MKINWEQSGMPSAFVRQMGARSKLSEVKAVQHDAQNQTPPAAPAPAATAEDEWDEWNRRFLSLCQ